MARKKYTTEQIIQNLRTIEIECGKGMTIEDAVRKHDIPIQSYYRWKKEYSGMELSQAKKLKELEVENQRLKKLVADLSIDKSQDVIFVLADLFLKRGLPQFIRSDNGPEFIAKELMKWFKSLDVQPLFIQPGSSWENGYIESLNGRMRDEFLNGEIFYTLTEAQVLIERWRYYYNTKRLHSSLGYKVPAPETLQPKLIELAM